MILFGLSNQKGVDVTPCKPWSYEPSYPRNYKTMDKAAFRAWCCKPTTKHLFFSGYEGLNPHQRVNTTNKPYKVHALVIDYDAKVSDEMLKEMDTPEFGPTGISRTRSGGARLVFAFEEPLFVYTPQVTKKFLARCRKELNLQGLLPGFDEEAFYAFDKYYEVGTEWDYRPEDTIPATVGQSWLIEASEKGDWTKEGPNIPIEDVAAEVERQFPRRWNGGDFVLGARGLRFWDPTADCPTAAIVRDTGMQCFTGPKQFMSWGDILGAAFVTKYEAEKTAGAIEDIWWDGKDYWLQDPSATWVCHNQTNLGKHLAVKRGLSPFCGKGDTFSEVDRAVVALQDHNRVKGAVPFVHQQKGIVTRFGRRYLNTSTAECLPPADKPQKWGQDFPWIADFLDGYFEPHDSLDFFLAYLKRFYETGRQGDLQPGQAVFIAGESGLGKTLLSTVIVATMMGGHVDASDYLLGETQFNKELFESSLWTIDDTMPAADQRKHGLFSSMLKKIVANRTFEWNAKFKDQQSIPWIGRIIVTCNADVESIRILPDMEASTLDKISLFKAASTKKNFPLHKVIARELPFFCRWLLDWTIPERCVGSARFGVKSYHETSLLETAKESSDSAQVSELLAIWKRSYFDESREEHWEGSATELLAEMLSNDAIRDIARSLTAKALGRALGKMQAQGAPLENFRSGHGGGRSWRIYRASKKGKTK